MSAATSAAGIDPRRSRRVFAALLLGAMLLIWTGTLLSLQYVARSDESAFLERMRDDALILEAHASRALDTVSARMGALALQVSPRALAQGSISSALLRERIRDDSILRSIAVVDEDGVVLVGSQTADEGARIPAVVLPGAEASSDGTEVRFGSVWPQRNLRDFAQPSASGPSASAREADSLIAVVPASDGSPLRVVAVIDLGVFRSLWQEVDDEEAHELALFDTRGQRWVSHHRFIANDNEVRWAIESVARRDPVGEVNLPQQGHRFTYRVSPRHPVVMAVIGDFNAIADRRSRQTWTFVGVAAGTSVALTALVLGLFRAYRRYEAVVIETANQSRAISAHLLVSESDREGNIVAVNENYALASGYSREELIGRQHRIFNSGIHPAAYYKRLWETVLSGQTWKGTFRNRRKDGAYYWVMATIIPFVDPWGRVERLVAFYTDITESMSLTRTVQEERRQREELARLNRSLTTAANSDALTGLANRRGFDSFVAQMLVSRPERDNAVAVLMIDLDRFKAVNDTYGHGAGDEVLKEVARRWAATIRDSDLLARLGGEEFCIVLPGTDHEAAQRIAETVRQATMATAVTITHDGAPFALPVTASVGLAWSHDLQSQDLAPILELADQALYEAKRLGRNRVAMRQLQTASGV